MNNIRVYLLIIINNARIYYKLKGNKRKKKRVIKILIKK